MASTLLLPFLLYSLILQSISVVAQIKSTIAIGDSFTAETGNSPWLLSPSGDFAFGFLEINNDRFLLSIWYAKIPEKTVVWYANGDSPAPKGSKVELTATHRLAINAPNGEQLWTTQEIMDGITRGVLNDTGNFVLEDGGFNTLWQTFSLPCDTLLPSQVLQKGVKLASRLKETNFSKGRFELLIQNDGNLIMHSLHLPSGFVNPENYYESGTVGSSTSSAGTQLVFDRSGDLYLLRENNDKYNVSKEESKVSTTLFYLRATLNVDGVFALFKHAKSSTDSGGWTMVWSQPENICHYFPKLGSGVCGVNSFCTLGDNKRPTCQCPKSYSLVDPDDPYGSCKPDFIHGCAEDELSKTKDLYDFEILNDTDWHQNDSVLLKPFTEERCKLACMEDCMCSMAIFSLGDSCWKRKLPLSNGRSDATLNGTKAFFKVRKANTPLVVVDPPPNSIIVNKNNNNRETLVLVSSVLLGSSAILNVALIVATCVSTSFIFQYKKKLRRVSKSDTSVETNLRCFTYEELEEATNGFDKELGRGSFGIVYEGVINTLAKTRVAVKKLNNFLLDQAHREFRNEVNVIGLTHHRNLVRLLGFCEGGSERLLVYEYMSNGSLASFLFNADAKQKPSWKQRQDIAIGIARGLVYLHEECITRIIHCDIKPQNILLDDYFNARISDFGLAKLLNMNESKTNTCIRGTKGYVALEWFKNMPITAKVDVYSYGVVLLEIISCRRCVEMDQEDEYKAILTDWAYDCYKEGILDPLVEGDNEALKDKENLEKLVMIAIWCVQDDPCLRPTMRNVIHMLEGTVEVQVPPYPSPISIQYSLN